MPIRQVHHDSSGRYGSSRLQVDLQRQGRGASRGRIERMIRAIMAPSRPVCTTDSRHDPPIAPNLVAPFTAPAPNWARLADITYIPTAEGSLYLAAVMDFFSRKIVGWAMRHHIQVELASAALTMAIRQHRPGARLIHHSDLDVRGGFKRSSQHSGIGGCDEQSSAEIGATWTSVIAIAGPAAGGGA